MQGGRVVSVTSSDSQGAVYIAGSAVYRVVPADQVQGVRAVLLALSAANIEGVVATEICSDAAVAAELGVPASALVLKHDKVEHISYAHEWCGVMLKDAALFQIDLSERLGAHGLYLKDAHPWNILFESGVPVFVDYASIVTEDLLFAETYLHANARQDVPRKVRAARLLREISQRMFLPYFVNPLCGYAFGNRARIRKAIEETTLNTSSTIVTWRDALPNLRNTRSRRLASALLRMRHLFRARAKAETIERRLEDSADVAAFLRAMRSFIAGLNVEIGGTAYSAYYKQKGEDTTSENPASWNDKQRSARAALEDASIGTVLDVACNTGWYAVMAAKLGKRVVAFDIDEGCIEVLYDQVRREKLNILPLVANFIDLSRDRYSVIDGKLMLINATERLRSDAVIALGIIHHLVLGLGMSFEAVLDGLEPLCAWRLVIEFVDKSDAVIRDEPSFFPAYLNNHSIIDAYSSETLVHQLQARGFEVAIEKSYPSTRSLLVCTRRNSV